MVEELITKLCQELETSMPNKGEDNSYLLKINEVDEVEVRPLEIGLSLHANFGALPEEKREEVVMHLMKANYLGEGTGGGVIGMSADEKYLTLSLSLPYEVTYKTFKERIEEFVNYVNYWREQM